MKKLFKSVPLFLVTLMILVCVLAACKGKDISAKVKSAEEKVDAIAPALPTSDIATPAPTLSPAPTPSPTPTPSSTPVESTFIMGSVSDGVYTNNFFKIGCKLDNSWTYFNDEQLLELSGITANAIGDEEISEMFQESVDRGKTINDMFAVSSDRLANINVALQNLGVVYGMALGDDMLLDIVVDSLPKMLESSGIENLAIEKSSVAFAGTSRPAITVTGEISRIPIYESIICIKNGNYMALIGLTTFYENITEQLAGLFYSIG